MPQHARPDLPARLLSLALGGVIVDALGIEPLYWAGGFPLVLPGVLGLALLGRHDFRTPQGGGGVLRSPAPLRKYAYTWRYAVTSGVTRGRRQMIRRAVAAKGRGRLGNSFLLACLFVLTLLLGHQLIMASPTHATEMGMDRGQATLTAGSMQVTAGPAGDLTPVDELPLTGWEACFSPEGLLPALLSLLTLVSIRWLCASATLPAKTPRVGGHISRFLHPPPLEPARRRALLQVFLI